MTETFEGMERPTSLVPELESELVHAAQRGPKLIASASDHRAGGRLDSVLVMWRRARRPRTLALALGSLLGIATIALAASGVLDGAPVRPEQPLSAVAGSGLPISGTTGHLLLGVVDPAGGLPWGMRVFHTTRGLVCVQVGRVQDGELGVLGLDSAFGDDGRFHILPTDALPPGYGGSSSNVECLPSGQTLISEDLNADRSAERLLPEEFREPPKGGHRDVPPLHDLRALAYGLLGRHAVSVTYRTPLGMRTVPVTGAEGAFLIVQPAGYIKSFSLVGDSVDGQAARDSVEVMPPSRPQAVTLVSATTFRFATKLCSQGIGAPIHRLCPMRRVSAPHRWLTPTRSLHAPVHLTLLRQSRGTCKAAFLLYPCYKGRVEFIAPYAITRAGSDYEIHSAARCKADGRPETGWSLERNVKRHEAISTNSLGLFVYMPTCAASESFEVRYLNQTGPSAGAPHESVVVGSVKLSQATLPDGTPMIGPAAKTPSR